LLVVPGHDGDESTRLRAQGSRRRKEDDDRVDDSSPLELVHPRLGQGASCRGGAPDRGDLLDVGSEQALTQDALADHAGGAEEDDLHGARLTTGSRSVKFVNVMVERSATTGDPKKPYLMEAALGVFLRYGFRKTSMDEVAKAAQLSRQALYLHFPNKEQLFRETAQYYLGSALEAAKAALADASIPLQERVVRALDAWAGRFVGAAGAGAADLAEVGSAMVGPAIARHEDLFADALAKALRAAGLARAYKPAGLTARQLADTLHATARGLKQVSPTREAFLQGISVAVRAMCLPLGERSS